MEGGWSISELVAGAAWMLIPAAPAPRGDKLILCCCSVMLTGRGGVNSCRALSSWPPCLRQGHYQCTHPAEPQPSGHSRCLFENRAALGEGTPATDQEAKPAECWRGGVGVPVMAQWLTNSIRNHEVADSIPGLSGLRIRRCWELWCRSQMRLGSSIAVAVG